MTLQHIGVAIFLVAAQLAHAQEKTMFVDDALLAHEVKASTQLRRADDGTLVVGPLTGPNIVVRIGKVMDNARPLARKGAGPAEQIGWLVLAAAPGGRTIVVANQLDRTTVYAPDGKVERTAGAILVAEGVAMCDQRLFLTGVHNGGVQGITEGLFEADTGRRVRLLYNTRQGNAVRPTLGSTDMLAVRGTRMLMGLPNRAELVVSDDKCGNFKSLPVAIPWFTPWDKHEGGYPFVKPIQTRTIGVRLLSDSRAAMLILRAYKGAKYETAPPSGARPLPQGKGPWAETVLVLVDLNTGRTVSEQVLPQVNWRFASDTELVAHTLESGDRSGFVLRPIEPTTRR